MKAGNMATEKTGADHGGKRYRVLNQISYPTDADVIKRLGQGEDVPHDERGYIAHPRVGTIVDNIPAVSVDWLLRDGHIEAVKNG